MFDARAHARVIEELNGRSKYGNPLTLDVRSASGEDTSEAYLSLYGQILIDSMRRVFPEPGVSAAALKEEPPAYEGEELVCVADGLMWRCRELDDGTASVLGCEPVPERLVVPPVLDGRAVTAIDRRAFFGCSQLVAVDLPDSIASIGDEAFRGTSLRALEIPADLAEIGADAFLPHTVDTYAAPTIRRVTVRPGNETFFMLDGLLCRRGPDPQHNESVFFAGRSGTYRIPDEVTAIGPMTFAGQRLIHTLIVHDHIERVELCGMYFSENLTRVVLEHAAPDGSDVSLAFPDSSTGIMALRVGFNTKTVDARLLSEMADGAIYNSKSRAERHLLMCRRLAEPLWLSPKRREAFVAELTKDIGGACRALAECGALGGIDLLAELGILNLDNFDEAVKALSASDEPAGVNQLLAVRRRKLAGQAFDFAL